ncbi:Ovule protein [Chitinophaga sp. 180180018-2]|nr:Ovule protein [Chitinophaga sp. 212800010-3]
MENSTTGCLLIICKKYTENGRTICWNSTGTLLLYSGKSVALKGKEGIKFRNTGVLGSREN